MGESKNKQQPSEQTKQERQSDVTDVTMDDALFEGRNSADMDIDRMVNEGLGGGNITLHNGFIDHSTTDTMREEE